MITVAQLTDVHLMRDPSALLLSVDTQASLEAVLARATAQPLDLLLVTGDIAQEPHVDVYHRFLETVRRFYAGQLCCLPGNHDVLADMQAAGLPMEGVALGDWRIACLDSHEDDVVPSLVEAHDLNALYSAAEGAAHCLVATHHHLFDVGCPWLDKDRIDHPDLLAWLAASETVRALVFGHVHQAITHEYSGIPLYGTPATCFQFQPQSQRFGVTDQYPGYRQLRLGDDGGVETDVIRVTEHPVQPKIPDHLV